MKTDYQPMEVVVVDNASTDDSCGWLRVDWPQVTLLRQERNLGYAGGNNVGIRYAMEKGHRYVVIANNDIEPHLSWIREAVAFAAAHPDYGIIGFKLFNQEITRPAFETYCRSLPPLAWQDTTHVPGCSLFCDTEVFQSIGFFDERYVFYAEENDFEMRALQAGWRAAELNVPVWHMGEASTQQLGLKRSYLCMRNFVRLHMKLIGLAAGLRAMCTMVNRACNPWPRQDFVNDYTLRRYRPAGLLTNAVLVLAAIGWNLAFLPQTLAAGRKDRERIRRHNASSQAETAFGRAAACNAPTVNPK